jgi:phage shock protein PspC (stress-responsive transcriptional regulator)
MSQTPGPSTTDEQHGTPTGGPPPRTDRVRARSLEELRRSTSDRKIAGVAGGFGRHLDIDPTIVRVVLVVLCFFGGAGFLLYGAAWALVPEDGQRDGNIAVRPSTRSTLLIISGVLATLLLLGDSWGGFSVPWPLFLVGVGALVFLAARDRGTTDRVPTQYPGQYSGQYPGQPVDQATGQPVGQPVGQPWTPAYDPAGTTYGQTPPPPWLTPTPVPPERAPRRPKRGPRLFAPTLALIAVALGSLGLYDASGGHVLDSAYPALALAVVGLMLVVGAFLGRGGGLVLLGILAAIALGITSLVGSLGGIGDGNGERLNATPLTASAVKDIYYVPNGRVVLDLSEVTRPAELAGRSIEVGARAGEVVVILPDGVVTHLDAEVSGPGQIDLPGHSSGGLDNNITETLGTGPGTFSIRAHLFAGHIDVRTS